MRMGGLGIRIAQRVSPGGVLGVMSTTVADRVVNTLIANEHPGELHNAAGLLDRHGSLGRPDWNSIRVGIRPEGDIHAEHGE